MIRQFGARIAKFVNIWEKLLHETGEVTSNNFSKDMKYVKLTIKGNFMDLNSKIV